MIKQKALHYYLLVILLLLFVLDFIFTYLEVSLGVGTPPSGMIGYMLILILLIPFTVDTVRKWPGKNEILLYYLLGGLGFLLVIHWVFYDLALPKWVIGGILTGFLFFRWIHGFLKKPAEQPFFPQYYLALVVLVFSMVYVISLSENRDVFDYLMVLKYLLLFVLGYFLFDLLKAAERFRHVFIAFVLILFGFMVMNIYLFRGVLVRGSGINYLRLAESLVFLSVLALVTCDNRKLQQLVFLISIFSLALVGSRTALFGFALVFFLFLLVRYGIFYCFKVSLVYLLGMAALMAMGVRLFVSQFVHIVDEMMQSKIVRLLLIPEEDTSLEARIEFFIKGLERIKNNILVGDFKGQLEYGIFGHYVHNFFSYWSQFGMVAFVLFTALMVMGLVFLIKRYKLNKQNKGYLVVLLYFLYGAGVMALAKSHVFVNVYLAFGLVLGAMKEERKPLNPSVINRQTRR